MRHTPCFQGKTCYFLVLSIGTLCYNTYPFHVVHNYVKSYVSTTDVNLCKD
jgi:hypothetical protein